MLGGVARAAPHLPPDILWARHCYYLTLSVNYLSLYHIINVNIIDIAAVCFYFKGGARKSPAAQQARQ
jgi:multisubunit Na+/H+ antiporter MnhB subunit